MVTCLHSGSPATGKGVLTLPCFIPKYWLLRSIENENELRGLLLFEKRVRKTQLETAKKWGTVACTRIPTCPVHRTAVPLAKEIAIRWVFDVADWLFWDPQSQVPSHPLSPVLQDLSFCIWVSIPCVACRRVVRSVLMEKSYFHDLKLRRCAQRHVSGDTNPPRAINSAINLGLECRNPLKYN